MRRDSNYRVIVEVQCKDCQKKYEKREDSLHRWSGLCRSCSSRKLKNRPEQKEISRKALKQIKQRADYTDKNLASRKKSKHRGKNHHSWKGGITRIERAVRTMFEYKNWRNLVFERDSWICQSCRIRGVYLNAHHIKRFVDIIKENNIKTIKQAKSCTELWDVDNGVTLCVECHNNCRIKP